MLISFWLSLNIKYHGLFLRLKLSLLKYNLPFIDNHLTLLINFFPIYKTFWCKITNLFENVNVILSPKWNSELLLRELHSFDSCMPFWQVYFIATFVIYVIHWIGFVIPVLSLWHNELQRSQRQLVLSALCRGLKFLNRMYTGNRGLDCSLNIKAISSNWVRRTLTI